MTKNRVMFIDGQVFQSKAWDRGIGKYSLNFIKALVSSSLFYSTRVYIIFDSNNALSNEVKNKLENIYTFNFIFINFSSPVDSAYESYIKNETLNRQLLDFFITHNLRSNEEADFLELALFTYESYPLFPSVTKNILLWYDLIPYLFINHYSKLENYGRYLFGFRQIFCADLILTISQHAARDLAIYLGIDSKKIVTIYGASILIDDKENRDLSRPKQYILMPSGEDFRKNNFMAVSGFKHYCKINQTQDVELIITSNFSSTAKSELLKIPGPGNVIFTGNVSESKIVDLYKNAACVLFVPEYEGLGLPVLESVQFDKPCICSDIDVFLEISNSAFYFVNEKSKVSIAKGIKDALNLYHWNEKQNSYTKIENKYSWSATAERALMAMDKIYNTRKVIKKRKRIAIMCPNPTGYSAIGKVVMQLHPYLAKYYDIDYYVEDGISDSDTLMRSSYLDKITNVYKASSFGIKDYQKYHEVIYHIGNSEYHIQTVMAALFMPGVAVIHDTDLSGLFNSILKERGYLDEQRILAEKLIDQSNKNNNTSYLTTLVNTQKAIISHSQYTEKAVSEIAASVPIYKINLPVASAQYNYGVKDSIVRVGVAGILYYDKGLAILENIAKDKHFANCKFYFFGYSMLSKEEVKRINQYPNIVLKVNLSDFEFQSMLSKLDILLNYRIDYRGETSLTVLEALRYGVLPIVRNVGWYKELPKKVAIKVDNEQQLIDTLRELVKDKSNIRKHINDRIAYVENYHSYEQYAKVIADLVDRRKFSPESLNQQNEKISKAIKIQAPKQDIIDILYSNKSSTIGWMQNKIKIIKFIKLLKPSYLIFSKRDINE